MTTLRTALWTVGLLGPLIACTPLGMWLYEDPALEVARVRLDAEQVATSPVLIALAVNNPNDFDLSTIRLELRLRLNGIPIGRYDRDSVVSVPKTATSTVALPLTPTRLATRAQLRALRSGTHRFAVDGRATFTTPVGTRKVRFAHEGAIVFGNQAAGAAGGRMLGLLR
ncbi:MAG: LEA type 2 family protein [Gemmatimonadales bacterium]